MDTKTDSSTIVWKEDDLGLVDETVSQRFYEIEQHADTNILNELSALGDELEMMAWRIGWLTDKLYKNLVANKQDVDYLFICYYVSITKLKGQRSLNTVKKWALTARFFPKKVAKQYNYDVLPMSHFSYAMSFGDQTVENEVGNAIPIWQTVLDFSWDAFVNSPVTRHISVRELKDKFEGTRSTPSHKTGLKAFDFVPGMSSSIDSVSSIPTNVPVEKDATPDFVVGIVTGIINNFTMMIGNYVPALTRISPDIGQALAGVIHNLELVNEKLEDVT